MIVAKFFDSFELGSVLFIFSRSLAISEGSLWNISWSVGFFWYWEDSKSEVLYQIGLKLNNNSEY